MGLSWSSNSKGPFCPLYTGEVQGDFWIGFNYGFHLFKSAYKSVAEAFLDEWEEWESAADEEIKLSN